MYGTPNYLLTYPIIKWNGIKLFFLVEKQYLFV